MCERVDLASRFARLSLSFTLHPSVLLARLCSQATALLTRCTHTVLATLPASSPETAQCHGTASFSEAPTEGETESTDPVIGSGLTRLA